MGNTTIDPSLDEDDTSTDADDTAADGTDADADADESTEDDDDEPDEAAAKAIFDALPANAQKYVKALQGKVTKANAQSAAKRRRLAELRKAGRKTPPVVKPTDPPKPPGDAPDFAAALAQFKQEQAEERRVERVQSRAESELRKAGLALDPNDADAAERKLARTVRMLELEGLEPEDVADAVEDLKADSPELFKRRRTVKPKTGGVSGPARTGSGPKAPDEVEKALDL